jgi:phosphate transport system substrate-binding protein
MNRKKGSVLAVVVAAAVAASIILAVAFYYQNNNNNATIPGSGNSSSNNNNGTAPFPPGGTTSGIGGGGRPAQKIPVSALSSPSALPFVEKWVAQYNSERNPVSVNVNYSDRADDASIPLLYSNISAFLADRSADLVIASRPIAAKGNFTYAGSVFLPVSPQAVAVVYNIPSLPDVPSGLRLDPATLYAVLSGNATYWDDMKIKSLNPNMSLPHKQIVVVHEGPAGSASDMLGRYLASASNHTLAWPESSLVADSANSLSAMVRQTPYSIGYVDFAFAAQTRMTYASLKNSGGQYLLPSADSIGAAVRNGTVVNPALVNGTGPGNPALAAPPPTISVGKLGNGSYPVVGFYYAAFSDRATAHGMNETAQRGKHAAVIDLVRWMAGREGQQVLKDMQYPSVYEHSKDLKAFADRVLGTKTGSSGDISHV